MTEHEFAGKMDPNGTNLKATYLIQMCAKKEEIWRGSMLSALMLEKMAAHQILKANL